MSDKQTPRTDALVAECYGDDSTLLTDANFDAIASLARTLERELAAAQEEKA